MITRNGDLSKANGALAGQRSTKYCSPERLSPAHVSLDLNRQLFRANPSSADWEEDEYLEARNADSSPSQNESSLGTSLQKEIFQRIEKEISDRVSKALAPFEQGLQGLLNDIVKNKLGSASEVIDLLDKARDSKLLKSRSEAEMVQDTAPVETMLGDGPAVNQENANISLGPSYLSESDVTDQSNISYNETCEQSSSKRNGSDSGYASVDSQECTCICHISFPILEDNLSREASDKHKGCAICFMGHLSSPGGAKSTHDTALLDPAALEQYFDFDNASYLGMLGGLGTLT